MNQCLRLKRNSVRTFATDFRPEFPNGVGVSDRLADDDFRLSILRTDFKDTPPEGVTMASMPDKWLESSLGVGARRADLRADFTGVLERGVDGSMGVVEQD